MCYWPLGFPISSHSCQMHLAKHPSWHPLALFLTLLCSLLWLWLPAEQHSLKLKYLTCTNLQPDSSSLRHGPNTQVLRRWTCKFTPEVRLPYKSNPQTTRLEISSQLHGLLPALSHIAKTLSLLALYHQTPSTHRPGAPGTGGSGWIIANTAGKSHEGAQHGAPSTVYHP